MGVQGKIQQCVLQAGALGCRYQDWDESAEDAYLSLQPWRGYRERFKQLLLGNADCFQCFIVDLWSCFVSKWVFVLTFCVYFFVRTSLAGPLCCSLMVTALAFRTDIFYSSAQMVRMCSLMRAVPRSASMVSFSTSVNSIVVGKLPILRCTEILPLIWSRSFSADKSHGYVSSVILGYQLAGKNCFDISFSPASLSRRHGTGWKIWFLVPIEIRTKYVDCSVTVIVGAWIVYLSGENFDFFEMISFLSCHSSRLQCR